MGFTEAVRHCLANFANFQGRAPRSQYWWWILFSLIVGAVTGFADGLIFGADPDSPGALNSLASLALLVPSLAVTARRLHDHNRSGWWQLAPYGMVPVALATATLQPPILFAAACIAAVALVLVLFYWMVTRGTAGTNSFGPDPLGPHRPGDGDGSQYHTSTIPRAGQD